ALAGLQSRELRLLEIGVDIDGVERDQTEEPRAGLHVVAHLDRAVAHRAVEGRAYLREGEIALGLGERGLQLLERAPRLFLLALGDLDARRRGGDRRLRALHRRIGLIAAGTRLLLGLAAGEFFGGERVLSRELELGAERAGLRGDELRLRLLDRGLLRRDLATEAVDGGPLRRDLVARRVDRGLVVAVVDGPDQIAGPDRRIFLGVVGRDVGGNFTC